MYPTQNTAKPISHVNQPCLSPRIYQTALKALKALKCNCHGCYYNILRYIYTGAFHIHFLYEVHIYLLILILKRSKMNLELIVKPIGERRAQNRTGLHYTTGTRLEQITLCNIRTGPDRIGPYYTIISRPDRIESGRIIL